MNALIKTCLAGFTAALALPAAAEPMCPATHTPGTPMVCDLLNTEPERFDADGTLSKRITLPLNTTIDNNELPTYSVFIDVEHTGATPLTLKATLAMVDDAGDNAIQLGAVESEVRAGFRRIWLDARAQRFAQPAYLTLNVTRSGGNSTPLSIKNINVIQAIGRDR